jgi:hypothetical protein
MIAYAIKFINYSGRADLGTAKRRSRSSSRSSLAGASDTSLVTAAADGQPGAERGMEGAASRTLARCWIADSKTIAGLSDRQRVALIELLHH